MVVSGGGVKSFIWCFPFLNIMRREGKKCKSKDWIKGNSLKSDILFIFFLVALFAGMVGFGYLVFLLFTTIMNWSKITGLILFFVFVYLVAKYCSY